ncbi:MAG: SH3 domain-containing protein [Caldilineaceae bacterium]
MTETKQIALDYQISNNLDQARAQLNTLKVANPSQWLVYVAETAIEQNNDKDGMTALAHLASDLGLQSQPINQFAVQHNLLKSALAAAGAPQKNTTDVKADGNKANAQPVAVQQAVTPVQSALVTTTTPVTQALTIVQSSAVANTTNQTKTQPVSTTLVLTPTPALQPTKVADTKPAIKATNQINVRSGPGTNYDIIGTLQTGESAPITAKNDSGDWWQVTLNSGQQGWVFGQLVETSGDAAAIAVAANIPTPPPTATPAPATPTTAPQATDTPASPTPVPNGNDFVMIQRHLWDVIENGGQLDGPSVTCGQARELIVHVQDANGSPLNGVAVQVQYGAREIYVTGAQGKGDGIAEFVLGGGQDVKVIKDVDGHEVTSDVATGLSTKPWEIPYETLIGGRFCQDDASCKSFVDHTGCYGHYSWTVTFKRQH